MNKAIAIGKLMLLENIRDRSFWIQLIAVPILLTLIMGVAFGGASEGPKKVNLAVADSDGSVYSKIFISQLNKDNVFSVKEVKEAEARTQVKKRTVSGAVIIPSVYSDRIVSGEKVEVEVLTTAGDNNAALLSQVVAGLTNRYSADAFAARKITERFSALGRPTVVAEQTAWEEAFEAADKKWNPAPVTVDSKIVTRSAIRGDKTLAGGFNQSSMGFTITFIMFMLVGGAATIIEERRKGTLGRILTTPTGKSIFISGKMMGMFATAATQAAILIVAGRLIFNVNWGRDPLPLIILLIAFIFSIASMGILIASLARTGAQINSTTPILLISMAMIGGCYWPIEITPPLMQTAAKFLPAGWMMKGLTDLITRGYGWNAVLLPSLVLLGFGAVFLIAGVVLLKYE
jgi:ABC-2 type transport system permease protein